MRKTHRNAEKIRKITQARRKGNRKRGEAGKEGEGNNTFVAMGRRKIYNILPTIMLLCERALIPPAWLCPRAIFLPVRGGRREEGEGEGERVLLSVLSRRITYIIDTLTLASNCRAARGMQGGQWKAAWAMTDRILVLFKMALNHGSRLAQENAETGTHTTRNRMCSRLKG